MDSAGAINRDPGLSMRAPTAANAPQIAIGPTGNGIVVWQEPEIERDRAHLGAANLRHRRSTTCCPSARRVSRGRRSPTTRMPRRRDLEARTGRGRLPTGRGPRSSPLPGPRIFLNILSGRRIRQRRGVSRRERGRPEVPGGRLALGRAPERRRRRTPQARVLYDSNGEPRVTRERTRGRSQASRWDPPSRALSSGRRPNSRRELDNPEGGGVSAWPSEDSQGRPGVGVREDFPNGAVQTALLSGGAGGKIGELAVGRSGLGDGLVAFRQGPIGDAAIVGAQVTAPPDPFAVTLPKGWVRPSQLAAAWAPAESANGPLVYRPVLDGRLVGTPQKSLAYKFPRGTVSTGLHDVQVLARTSWPGRAECRRPCQSRRLAAICSRLAPRPGASRQGHGLRVGGRGTFGTYLLRRRVDSAARVASHRSPLHARTFAPCT